MKLILYEYTIVGTYVVWLYSNWFFKTLEHTHEDWGNKCESGQVDYSVTNNMVRYNLINYKNVLPQMSYDNKQSLKTINIKTNNWIIC